MTIGEMHASILLEIDQIGSYNTSNLVSGEIDDYINSATRDYVNQYRIYLRDYLENSNESKEAIENLRTLEDSQLVTTITTLSNFPNSFTFDLTNLNNYDYYISGRAFFPTKNYWKDTKVVNRSYLDSNSKTAYNNPIYRSIPIIIDDNSLIGLYGVDDGEIPSKLLINYLEEPVDVSLQESIDSDLPEHTHRDIVRLAVQKISRSLFQQQDKQG